MKLRLRHPLLFLLIILCAFHLLPGVVLADSYTANTMRLLHYEGDVEVEDEAGNPRFIMENVRLNSGESMHTGKDSLASVGLDSEKIVSLDENSQVDFVKKGNALELALKEGQIFIDVQEKLDANESFDIQVSTMSVGIRGTMLGIKESPESYISVSLNLCSIR